MAAIISQMAANKRARAKGQLQVTVSSDKCVYTLPPFDPCFDPLVHNKYMRAMEQRRLLKEGKKTEGQSFKTKEKQTRDSNVISELLSGFAILAMGFILILVLIFYIWVLLWDVSTKSLIKLDDTDDGAAAGNGTDLEHSS